MSKKNVALFYNEVVKDEDLKSKLQGVNEATLTEEVFESKVLPVAKEKGYDFTYADVKEYYKEQGKKTELNPDKMEAVSGGSGCSNTHLELSGTGDETSKNCRYYETFDGTAKAESTCGHCVHLQWSGGVAYCAVRNR